MGAVRRASVVVILLLCSLSASAGQFTDIGADLVAVHDGSVAWGDFDNDGDLDLAIAGAASGAKAAEIYRNDGGGAFSRLDAGLIGASNSSLAWGDYDGDGYIDLAVTGARADGRPTLTTYHNDGDGTFTTTGSGDYGAVIDGSLFWGDGNNDGRLELATVGDGYGRAYLGGNSAWGSNRILGSSACWVDYNKDGWLDLAVAGCDNWDGPRAEIYRNSSTGASAVVPFAPALTGCSMSWADANNDGTLDVALAGTRSDGQGSLSVYLCSDGVFTSWGSLPGVTRPSVAWGDCDNDGRADLAVAGYASGSAVLRVYRNTTDGFVEMPENLVGVESGSIAWGDYDGDGDLDLVAAGFGATTRVYRNDCQVRNHPPSAPSGLSSTVESNTEMTLRWCEATDDTTPAAGLSYNLRIGTKPGAADVFSAMADAATGLRRIPALGNVQKRLSWTIGGLDFRAKVYYWSVQAIDAGFAGSPWAPERREGGMLISGHVRTASGEPIPDAMVYRDSGTPPYARTDSMGAYQMPVPSGWTGALAVWLPGHTFAPSSRPYTNVTEDLTDQDYVGSGDFTNVGALPIYSSSAMAWGDYDGDGDLDLAVTGMARTLYGSEKRQAQILRNDHGVFTDIGAPIIGVTDGAIAWVDCDNDGDLDLSISGMSDLSTWGSWLAVYRNDAGVFTDTLLWTLSYWSPSIAWGDYGNDGDLEMVCNGGIGRGQTGEASVYGYQGAGQMGGSCLHVVGIERGSMAWIDYDRDGVVDLCVSGRSSTEGYLTRIYRSTSDGLSNSGVALPHIGGKVVWGDYDNDGDLDFAISGDDSDQESLLRTITRIYRNDGIGIYTDIGAPLMSLDRSVSAWVDYDGDGDLDLSLFGYDYSNSHRTIGELYRNDGGAFVDSGLELPGTYDGTVAWGDMDGDGDQDLALSGMAYQVDDQLITTSIYRNDGPVRNTAPTAPQKLSAVAGTDSITFSWSRSTDAETPPTGLSYNLRVGTAPGKGDVFSSMSDPVTGQRHLPAIGNAQKRLSWTIKGLDPRSHRYYWSVQAIDASYAGSPWAQEADIASPENAGASPTNGTFASGAKFTLSTAYRDPNGYGDIATCYSILNPTLSAANSIELIYHQPTNKLFLQNDAGNVWLGGITPGTSGATIENSRCIVYCGETTVSASGNDLTVNWKIAFKPTMANKTCGAWLRVTDKSGLVDEWEKMACSISVGGPPVNVGVSPASGSYAPSMKLTMSTSYSDPDGRTDLNNCYAIVNPTLSAANSIELIYNQATNKLYLQNDAGNVWIGGVTPGTAGATIENSRCIVYCGETTVTGSDTNLTVNWRIAFKPTMAGKCCGVWLRSTDRSGLVDEWEKMASGISVGTPPSNVRVSPTSGTYAVGSKFTFSTSYADPDGYTDLNTCYSILNPTLSAANSVELIYHQPTNKLYLQNDAGNSWLGGVTPGTTGATIENSRCIVYCSKTTVSASGSNLTVDWKIALKSPMAGKTCGAWLRVNDRAGMVDEWESMGAGISIDSAP